MACAHEPHEGVWMYVSVPPGEQLEHAVNETCRRHGWPVVSATSRTTQRRLQALRLADACIVDISSATADAGAELAFALCEGRPLIAFRSASETNAPLVEDLLRDHPAVHQLSRDDLAECVAALDSLLGDPAWHEQVARAAPRD
jgi:hypothetical protein